MLELIVLGHIPGTDIYLSFAEVALIAVGLALAMSAYAILRSLIKTHIKKVKSKQALIFSESLQDTPKIQAGA